jgi:carboxymethylenebutenolidase
MCHDDDSRPPGPPNPGAVAEHGPVTLTSADGTEFGAYLAVPDGTSRGGIVIVPDIRGLHPYYEQLAVRFAEAGFHAVGIDHFGRTLGVGPREEVPDWQQLIAQVRPEDVEADVAAAVARLRESTDGPVFTVGFCFGGGHSWRLAATGLDLAGCIGFYGRPVALSDVEADIHRPLLLLVAGADRATPLADFQALDARLTERGQVHEMVVYDGAPHSFFDRAFGEWGDACADAWVRILEFTERYGATPPYMSR